ncbi:MAG: hypothetical protein ISS93_03670 [Candidatus Aenigmarchaeota archaeon]|nr:hypothetical protein [Candidatus Aenigmarchaeota archaeon]
MMRGFFLSLDAIVAVGLLMLLATFIAGFSMGITSEELQAKQVYYLGKDINNILFEVEVKDLLEFPSVQGYYSQGLIRDEDFNLSFIELIGYWWSVGNFTQARNVTGEVLDSLVNSSIFGYEIFFDNTSMYNKSKTQERLLVRTYSLISGFELGRQPSGHVASAFVREARKNTSMVLAFSPQGSGVWEDENVYITKKFYVNSTEIVDISNAILYISLHFGNENINAQKFNLNGEKLNPVEIAEEEKEINGRRTTLYFGYATADTEDINSDAWNTLEVRLKGKIVVGDGWHSHIHPGFRLELELQENTSLYVSPLENTTYYFDNILSEGNDGENKRSGAWATMPFHIPQGASDINVTLFIHGQNINFADPGDPENGIPDEVPEKHNIQVYLNDVTVDLTDPVEEDPELEQEIRLNYELTANVINGTNVVSVYLNAYGDYFWGKDNTILYSDPENDPDDSSYIQVQYVRPSQERRPGRILVGDLDSLEGIKENPKIFNKSFNGSEVSRVFLNLAQLDSENVTVNVTYASATQKAFQTPRPYATPSTIFIDPQILGATENNTLKISDVCNDQCDILPESSLEYYIWIPFHVGYGDIFPNSTTANADALERLSEMLSQYVTVTDFVNRTISVPEIPFMWGPARMEVRVWL